MDFKFLENKIEYFLKDHFKIKLDMTIMTLFLFLITALNIYVQSFSSNTSMSNIYIKIKDYNFVQMFLETYNYMIIPLKDSYYENYYSNQITIRNIYWTSIFFTFCYFYFGIFFYLNINNHESNIKYIQNKKVSELLIFITLLMFSLVSIYQLISNEPYLNIFTLFFLTNIEILAVLMLLIKYLKSILLMIIGYNIYLCIFNNNIFLLKEEFNFEIFKEYKIVGCFYIFVLSITFRDLIKNKIKYIINKINMFFIRIKSNTFKVKINKKNITTILKISISNIFILLSTYVIVVSVWSFLNKTGGFLISSLIYLNKIFI